MRYASFIYCRSELALSLSSRQRNSNTKIFLSHASEDKDTVARPLAIALKNYGFDVWYDEFELKIGDSLTQKINEGLASCTHGIVILSKSFFAKKWTIKELNALNSKSIESGYPVILPIWHEITAEEVRGKYPMLADLKALPTTMGIQAIALEIADAIRIRAVPQSIPKVREKVKVKESTDNALQSPEALVLAVLFANEQKNGSNSSSRLRLQKLMFLLQKEFDLKVDFKFTPYAYGPYSPELAVLESNLESHDLLQPTKGHEFKLTLKGRDLAEKVVSSFDRETRERMFAFVTKYGELSVSSLLEYVHRNYPSLKEK